MAITKKQEARALSAEEHELVRKSHHPEVKNLSDGDFRQLLNLVRERRDRARDEANRRRREIRGKAAPKGVTSSRADEGSKLKVSVLAMAMRRLNREAKRRRNISERT